MRGPQRCLVAAFVSGSLFLKRHSLAESVGSCTVSKGSTEKDCKGPELDQLNWPDNAPRPPPQPGDSELHSESSPEVPGADADHLHGLLGRFSNGSLRFKAVPLPPNGLSKKERRVAHRGFCFNSRVSESLPLDRHQQDIRSNACRALHNTYSPTLPVASIIFVFHNENLSVLLRSIHSVLNRSPPRLLSQVILVDDASVPAKGRFGKKQWLRLQQELDDYCRALPKLLLVRLRQRRGLMLARMEGAWRATGDILIFLDSHIEATTGWLEPLLARIAENRTRLLVPEVDTIDAETFRLSPFGLGVVGFTWKLGQSPSRADFGASGTKPAPSPVMPGGLFAADKRWFMHLGGYDPEMRIYGGEEMEISFRTWMCGGSVESVPCSHVGHVFRSSQYWEGQAYEVPAEEVHRNKLRTAHVWMDGYRRFAEYSFIPMEREKLGNLSARKSLRKKLGCHSFSWFLNNVVPDMHIPPVPKKGPMGALANLGVAGHCVDTMGRQRPGDLLGIYPCHGQHGAQAFAMDTKGHLRIPVLDYVLCLGAREGKAVIAVCNSGDTEVKWDWQPEPGNLITSSGKCLAATQRQADGTSILGVAICREKAAGQKWSWD